MPEPVHIGNSTISFDDEGELDEIIVGDKDGKCLFHLESMGNGCWWMAVYDPETKDQAVINFFPGWNLTVTKNGQMTETGQFTKTQ